MKVLKKKIKITMQNFEEISKEIVDILDSVKKDIYKNLAGNAFAGRRARAALIKLEKKGKIFRKESIKSDK